MENGARRRTGTWRTVQGEEQEHEELVVENRGYKGKKKGEKK